MAAALVCIVEPARGCGACRDCRRVLKRGHPDVHHLVPEGAFIRVEAVRESLIPEVARSPFEAAMKVFVIEEADRMNPSAQNALLKTLEEPPRDTVLILVSEREEEILETIRSRCLVIRFEPLPVTVVTEMLERDGAPLDLANLAVRVAPNDLTRAREIALDDVARVRRALWLSIPGRLSAVADAVDLASEVVTEVRETIRVREREHKDEIAEVMETLGDARGTAALKTMLANRYKRRLKRIEESLLAEVLDTLAGFYRDVLALRIGAVEAVGNIDQLDQLEVWAEAATSTPAALTAMVERCAEATTALSKNANPTLTIESVLLESLRLVPRPLGTAA